MGKQDLFIFLLISCNFMGVSGYPNGLVTDSCINMTPLHGGANAQTSAAPFSVTASKTTYSPGDQITVTLQAKSGTFRGFLLQARQIGGGAAVGSFTITDPTNTRGLNCNADNSAVSHMSSSDKSQIQATWNAPKSGTGNVEFRATFVKSEFIFWVQVKSSQVSFNTITPASPAPASPAPASPAPASPAPTSPAPASPAPASPAPASPAPSSPAPASPAPASSAPVNSAPASSSFNPSSSLVLISSAGCGTNKTCFSNPAGCNAATNADCYFMSSASPQGGSDGIQFEISGKSNGYISIGFSDDTEMGNDDIYICGQDRNGNIQVQHAFSTGRSTPTIIPLENVYNIATSFNNGIIKCSFITRNAISTQQRAANTSYYIFMANGQTNGGAIQYHPLRPFITEDKVNLLGSQIASGNANRPAIIKTHGALMLIAWMTTGSIGMISARYFKQVSKGKQILGKDIWFQAHVFLMLLTVAATITAFVLAFVSVRGWSGGAHPVIGCIVMGLALIQPLIAVFRCAPDSKRRIVFNLVHAINALVIKVLAVTSIFLGLQLLDNSPNQWLPKVMGGFVGWEFLIYLVLDFNLFLKKEEIYENVVKTPPEPKVLLIYILGNLMFLIALLVGIGQT
ncbi:putative ferric-chelate reductase 1 isoform X2 [Acipenser ruthenus]|uniref:putative ferric-chelate reductase 1 isoform X2 n=1 Tax=Acipenser ruthenus TaxID=7906 RepID=UPI002741B3B0|nr:putative ferric-chelate reductase 1 isoform X2 [Acipenser ruthenus]